MYPWFFYQCGSFSDFGQRFTNVSSLNAEFFIFSNISSKRLWFVTHHSTHPPHQTPNTKHQTPHNTTPQHAHTTSPNTTAHRTTPRPTSNHLVQHVTMTDDKTNRKLCHKYSIFKQIVRLIKFLQTMNKR